MSNKNQQQSDEQSESTDASKQVEAWRDIPHLNYWWLREHDPELFQAIFREPKIFSEEPAANWPPLS